MPSPYRYQPLSSPSTQIRLLELLPGRGIIQCRLQATELKDASGTYEPISYCWKAYTHENWLGASFKEKEKEKTFRIRIDGGELYITESLQAALQQMRLKSEVRLLWADAVCINQKDDDEKSAQVAMMGKIYQSGKKTLAWLGTANCWTGRAFRDLKLMSSQISEGSQSSELFEEPINELDGAHGDADGKTGRQRFSYMWYRWKCALRTLYYKSIVQRPYFERAWIFQEVVLSNNVLFMCGKHEITLDELRDGLWQGQCAGALPWGITFFSHSIGDLWDNQGLYGLDTILSKLSHTKTSDPRDKLYSALGLHEKHRDGVFVPVDYSKDVDEVFLETTRLLLSRSPSLNLLSMSNCTNRSEGKDVPSWVWNPQSGSTEYHLSWAGADRRSPFSASRGRHPRPQFQGRMIGLLGYVFNNVMAVGKCMPQHSAYLPHSLLLESLRCYLSWVDVSGICEQDITEVEEKRRMRALRCTLTPLQETYDESDIWYSNWDDQEDERDFQLFHAEITKRFSKFLSPAASDAGFRQVLALRADIWSLYLRLVGAPFLDQSWVSFVTRDDARAVFDRCFVRLENGDYALCPPDTRPDDRLFLLEGADVPILLRPSGENWTLVGECYVYGVMYGELWDQDRCEMLWIE